MNVLDRIDKHILVCLQDNGDLTNQELAEKVALSPSPCARRVKHLRKQGYIKCYAALLDAKKLGLELRVMVAVSLSGHTPDIMQQFEKSVSSWPEVMECHLVAGQVADYLLKVVIADLNHYQTFLLQQLTAIPRS